MKLTTARRGYLPSETFPNLEVWYGDIQPFSDLKIGDAFTVDGMLMRVDNLPHDPAVWVKRDDYGSCLHLWASVKSLCATDFLCIPVWSVETILWKIVV